MTQDAQARLEAMEFLAPILEAQMRFDQSLTNRLMDNAWEAAETWAQRYIDLFNAVSKANDSIRVSVILEDHWYPGTYSTIAHYRAMRGREGGDVV